jgi:hypothetical protein
MLSPANLFRMMTEMIFVLLGGLLVWVGLSSMFLDPRVFDPRKPAWLALGAVLVYWDVRAWIKRQRAARTAERTVVRVGGASLALVGLMMLGLVFVEFRWVGTVLATAGGILVLRGLVSAVLSLRTG